MDDKQKLQKALHALRIANDIMQYCGGDAWEREATAKDRKAFNTLYKEVTDQEGEA